MSIQQFGHVFFSSDILSIFLLIFSLTIFFHPPLLYSCTFFISDSITLPFLETSILSFFNICLSCLLFYDIFTLLLIVCIYIFVKQSIYLCNTWNFQISLNFFFSSLSTLVSCQSQYSSVLIFSVLLSCLNLSASTAIPLAFFLFFCVYHSPRIPFLLIQCSKYLYSSVLVITPLFKNLMCPY